MLELLHKALGPILSSAKPPKNLLTVDPTDFSCHLCLKYQMSDNLHTLAHIRYMMASAKLVNVTTMETTESPKRVSSDVAMNL